MFCVYSNKCTSRNDKKNLISSKLTIVSDIEMFVEICLSEELSFIVNI